MYRITDDKMAVEWHNETGEAKAFKIGYLSGENSWTTNAKYAWTTESRVEAQAMLKRAGHYGARVEKVDP